MPVFITSKAQARRHGVYAIEKTPPAAITATGTGTVALIEQFPWGPAQSLTFSSDFGTMLNTFAPPGMARTGSGWLSVIRKQFARLGLVRVLHTGAVTASANLQDVVPATIVVVTLKYPGLSGNSVTWTVGAATDGVAQHFDLTVTVSGLSGVTSETVRNINVSGTGADSLPTASDYAKLYLIGSITKTISGRPLNGSGSFTGGTDGGAIVSADYVGVAGTANAGIALCESDKTIDFVMTGDPGNTLRAAVNAGLMAHADLMTDRMAVINGNSGQTAAAAQADVASYRSKRCIYVDPWVYILDDTDGTKRLVPPAPFAAAVASMLPPSTSIAWKSSEARSLLGGINDIEVGRGNLAADNTDNGIVTIVPEDTGGYSFESAKNTNYPADPTTGSIKRTRMGHYIARSVVKSLRPYTDAPNVPLNQQDEIEAVDEFLANLKANAKIDPNHIIHIADYNMADSSTLNPQVELDAGQFTIGANIKISSDQEKIYFLMNYGETVKISVGL